MSQWCAYILGRVNARAILRRPRALRWLALIGVLGSTVVIATALARSRASERDGLPATDAASLISGVQKSDSAGWSGTVVSTLSLGLPRLPGLDGDGGAPVLTSVLSGTHSLQVWYSGADRQRITMVDRNEETDVFRRGRDLWQWSSAQRRALHVVLPAGSLRRPAPTGAATSLTPDALARRALAAIEPTTTVVLEHHGPRVADRPTYGLVLTPRVRQSLIGSVRIAVDASTKLPLAVQVYARSAAKPVVDVAFTSIRFARPSERNFTFTPPFDARVNTVRLAGERDLPTDAFGSAQVAPTSVLIATIGTGWSTVTALRLSPAMLGASRFGVLRAAATPVSGRWGRGALFRSSVLDGLLTSDGRVYLGAVEPAVLYAAASTK